MSTENDIVGGGAYGVRIPAAEAASLIENQGFYQEKPTGEETINTGATKGESTEAETERPTEDQSSETKETPAEPDVYKFEDQEYSRDQILEALKDSQNKDNWQKSQTEKDQQLAHDRKAVQMELQRFNSLKENSDLMETLKDYLGEDHDFFQESTVPTETIESQDTDTDVQSTISDPVKELKSELEVIKAERKLERDIAELQGEYPDLKNNQDAVNQVLEIAMEKEMPNLRDAYKLARFDTAESSAVSKAYKAFQEAQKLKDVPEATGESKGNHSEPVKSFKDYDSVRDHVLKEYDLVT